MECVKIAYVTLAQFMKPDRFSQVVVVLKLDGVEQKDYLPNILYTKANVALFPQFEFGGLGHKYKSRNIAFRFSFLGPNLSISV
jgi:hypothetical protein